MATISFTGFPGTPILLSTGELVPFANTPVLIISGITNHGNSCIGTPTATITYTITNVGASTASGVTVNSDNAQFVVSNLSSATIASSGGTATYQVTFTASSSGAQNATITVASTTAGSNSPTSSLTGTGIAPPTTADAGPDQTICTSGGTLAANTATSGTGAWSVLAGSPSTLNSQFSSLSNPAATFTPAGGPGVYTLRWTISNSPCTASTDDVVITANAAATVNAGADQTVCSTAPNVTLAGVIGGSASSAVWSGGTGTFSPDNTTLNATYIPSAAELSAGGNVTLTLTTDDPAGVCNAVSDQMVITINLAASANAGVDQTICTGSTVSLVGIRSGTGVTSSTWTRSGTGSFSSTSNLSTTYTPSAADIAAGTVTITLTTNDPAGPCGPASDFMVVTIHGVPAAPGPITGPTPVCANTAGLVYSISTVPTATTYTWAVPSGWLITGGQGTESITVTAG